MLSLRSVFLFAVLSAFAVAAPAEHTHRVKETVLPPRGWTALRPASPAHTIELRIGLPQPNFAELEDHLYAVSDPSSERYGGHLSKEEVEALVAPHPESVHLVEEWLASHGLLGDALSRSPAGDWVTVRVPVSLAEKMLDTTYHMWTHTASGDSIVRTTSYSLPEHLHAHIDVVQPTTAFSRFTPMRTTYHSFRANATVPQSDGAKIAVPYASGGQVAASCNGTITPACLLELYNATGYTPQVPGQNKIAVTGYREQYANYDDYHKFLEELVPYATDSTFSVVYINGGLNNQTLADAGLEADLDTQYAFSLTYPTPGTFYTTGGSPPFIPDDVEPTNANEPYLQASSSLAMAWLEYVLATEDLPQSISSSYGDAEPTVPYSYAKRVCAEFAQLGARGVSVMFASGDGGVGDSDPDPATQECYSNDGTNRTMFIPIFPASCPYVTSVGATSEVPEIAAWFSGGGFSNYWTRPSYQDTAVTKYLDALAPETYAGLYNPSGRASPDVSAEGVNFTVVWELETMLVDGTSCSSPTFAALVSLLNDARIASGKSTLGFLNPLIYALNAGTVTGFNDITVGNNPGCGTEGFNATIGWDPVTGWGSPNFGILKELVLSA
ncbi:peptidase S8/S53 domain-containing protein [Rhodofomes roseus]|uniref:Peptidase S8/S53 domain-containing protein n=1 Tax=Rhodofomes roseus TaxID=34475 RepID=A0ABQ8KJV9_9APHY|nr:peptidase S8/S53 domain-containing protein [Rhodofomes roseus]KAH9837729.1 peptidase S8/S53 domain-containing protein [Rhodofomes roseus]